MRCLMAFLPFYRLSVNTILHFMLEVKDKITSKCRQNVRSVEFPVCGKMADDRDTLSKYNTFKDILNSKNKSLITLHVICQFG